MIRERSNMLNRLWPLPLHRPTVCVTGVWAGVDSAWEQKKLEARKMLVNRADSHTSGAPWNDGGPSFSTKERLAASTEVTLKAPISSENNAFRAIFGCRSENAVLGAFCSSNFTLNIV